MGMLRLTLLAVIALADVAHGSPLASPDPVRAPPPGWRLAPELARATANAAGTTEAKVAASKGWSEPSLGCYAVWLRITGPALQLDQVARQLVASIKGAGIEVRDVAAPVAGSRAVVAIEFAKALYRGTLRAALMQTGEVDIVTCAWNQREPTLCAAACAKFTGVVR